MKLSKKYPSPKKNNETSLEINPLQQLAQFPNCYFHVVIVVNNYVTTY